MRDRFQSILDWWTAEDATWGRRAAQVTVIAFAVSVLVGAGTIASQIFGGEDDSALPPAASSTTSDPQTTSSESAAAVSIEADIGIANVTAGDTDYRASVVASAGEVLKLQIWYYNREDVQSGLYAAALQVSVALPQTRSTDQQVSAQVRGQNTNVVDLAVAVQVPEGAVLTYISGSAKWRHVESIQADADVPYVTEVVNDSIVSTGVVLEDAPPCLRCEATVTILMSVEQI